MPGKVFKACIVQITAKWFSHINIVINIPNLTWQTSCILVVVNTRNGHNQIIKMHGLLAHQGSHAETNYSPSVRYNKAHCIHMTSYLHSKPAVADLEWLPHQQHSRQGITNLVQGSWPAAIVGDCADMYAQGTVLKFVWWGHQDQQVCLLWANDEQNSDGASKHMSVEWIT